MQDINCPACNRWVGVLVNKPGMGIPIKCDCGHSWLVGGKKSEEDIKKKRKKKASTLKKKKLSKKRKKV